MINTISVRNFQSLEDITLELGSITTVVGQTDSGKSSFIRAVQAALFNDAAYEYATIRGEKVADEIQVEFMTDTHCVLWRRNKVTAWYQVIDSSGNTLSYTKLGRGVVPEDVQDILGVREIVIDETTNCRLQFAEQHDPPFLVGDRGGVGATRLLGRLSGVFVLSNANKFAQSDKQRVSVELDTLQSRQKSLVEEISNYDGVELRKQLIDEAKAKTTKLLERHNLLREMMRIRASAAGVAADLKNVSYDPVMDQAIASWDAAFQSIWPKLGQRERKVQLSQEYHRAASDAEYAAITAGQLELAPTPNVSFDQYSKLKSVLDRLSNAVLNLHGDKQKLTVLEVQLDEAEQQLAALDQQCPLCPFQEQFKKQKGVFRCPELMKAINQS